ncbi:alpha/beta hydrolase [Streptomyces sp. N2-109]|uniref:Alpha/beta hydrolase n=1 Tax=Streptomyces gossypii TaxID=2883101 RepID=A0ABT2JKQ8_9ACTN|nr:alpha/beta hydrolase [Streptomyces gossypii]MCT2588455.1 alpha/beta hydrolase [Streptomyces gossypii]
MESTLPNPPRAAARRHPAARLTLQAAGLPLSALLSHPPGGAAPRAVIVALHGGGMHAGYFDAPAHPPSSLLALGAQLGYTVLAIDRPGYGPYASRLPLGQTLAEQTRTLQAALADFTARHECGGGLLLLAHSFGGKLALCAAAAGTPGLLGLDISGCGLRYTARPGAGPPRRHRGNWGPLGLYPPGTFTPQGTPAAPMPPREEAELGRWPRQFTALAPRIRVPVRFTFAQHEKRWRHGETEAAELAARLPAAPHVTVDLQRDAGHNISLGLTARSYHLRAAAFLEDCLARARPRV